MPTAPPAPTWARSLTAGLALLGLAGAAAPAQTSRPVTDYALPQVGTAPTGHAYPGAAMPFGLVQLSPDTRDGTWEGCSGYTTLDDSILGFSHTHLSGTGASDLGDVLLMPTVGPLQLEPGDKNDVTTGFRSDFTHIDEYARPGYYRVFLRDPKITVELTATERVGVHRYSFPASKEAHVVIDAIHGVSNKLIAAEMSVENATTVSGHRHTTGWARDRDTYFVAQFSKPFKSFGLEKDGKRLPEGTRKSGDGMVKGHVDFETAPGEQISVKVGISPTSIEGARKNLRAEVGNKDFDAVRAAADAAWTDALGSIQIETTDDNLRRTFYTNLYLSMLAPTLLNDADGTYRGNDHKNHAGAGFNKYTTLSLWDTFRAEHPLLTIVRPGMVNDVVRTMLSVYKEADNHELPVWTLWANETGTMIGYHSMPVIADAYLKGFRDYDAEAVFAAMKDTAMQDRHGQDELRENGYISSAGGKQSVSRTLEVAYDDWCIAQMAKALGKTEDYDYFLKRSKNYKNVFDAKTGFMRGKLADGSWREPFNPKKLVWDDYTEANAWQYTWSVQQDAPALVEMMGGDQKFINKLDAMFDEMPDVDSNIPDITGLIGQYAHGNEPCHHVAYLYSFAGAPWRTAERVRQICDLFYRATADGQCGNIDCGQTSAWYVFSALGLYPVNPASGVYVIGSPLVDAATIKLDPKYYKGGSFKITARNNSPANLYVQSATLNGKPLERSWITHKELVAGGELVLRMGPTPNKSWGKAMENRPPAGLPTE